VDSFKNKQTSRTKQPVFSILLLGSCGGSRLLLLEHDGGLVDEGEELGVLLRHVLAKNLGHNNASVALEIANLEVLQNAADGTGGGAHGAVQHVHVLRLLVTLLGETIADLHDKSTEATDQTSILEWDSWG
jgi:hypothetical protein